MAFCGPENCAVPSCASTPVVGFGSAGIGTGPFGGISYGSGALVGPGVPSASLGVLSGINPSCINQIPPAEIVIQPPASIVTIPGPILSASCEPVSVGGNTPCALSGFGSSGLLGQNLQGGLLGSNVSLGSGQGSFLGANVSRLPLGRGRYGFVGQRGSICYTPC